MEDLFRNVQNAEPWSNRWLNMLPCHRGRGISDEARGFVLPYGFVDTACHGSKIEFCDSIASIGLTPGGLAGRSKRAICHFSIMDWRLAKP